MKSFPIRVNLIIILLVLFIPHLVSAESKTFIKEYTYQASEADSKLSCRTIALEQVKRLLLEELGVYLISKTEVRNYQLATDTVTSITAGIVSTQIIDENWNGEKYYLKAKITADTDEVSKAVKNIGSDSEDRKALQETRERADKALLEIERLKKELATLKQDKDKLKAYVKAVDELKSTDLFLKGYALLESKKWAEAVDAFDKVLGMDPLYVHAYNYRGVAYRAQKQYDRALKDFDRTLELDPSYAKAIFNKGSLYMAQKNYDKAIESFSRVIEIGYGNHSDLDRKAAVLYVAYVHYGRGCAYLAQKKYAVAIEDFSQALEIAAPFLPKLHALPSERSPLQHFTGDFRLAPTRPNDDEILFYWAEVYMFRGGAYRMLKQCDKAIDDIGRALEIDPKFALAYQERGQVYLNLGKVAPACADLKTACDLGVCKGNDLARDKKYCDNGVPSQHMLVRQDFLKYLRAIAIPEQKEAIDAYASISGKNYRGDDAFADVLASSVLPKYGIVIRAMGNIAPETTEVRQLHSLLLEGANNQMEGFTTMLSGAQLHSKETVDLGNEKLIRGKQKIRLFNDEVKAMKEQYLN